MSHESIAAQHREDTTMTTRLPQFETIADVTAHLFALDPQFSAEVTEDEMRDIVRANHAGRYQDIARDNIDAMYEAAIALATSR